MARPRKSAAAGDDDGLTPMMRQFFAAKQAYPDAILFFRMGDFFEMFHDDAVVAAKLLEITLTSRGPKGGDEPPIPMCGVPAQAVDGYVARLVRLGYKVALCDQVEDPRKARGLVKREVTRVATPGTTADPQAVDSRDSTFLAALARRGDQLGIGFAELSTGRIDTTELPFTSAAVRIADELARYAPREILLPAGAGLEDLLPPDHGAALTERSLELANPEQAAERLRRHLGVQSLASFGLDERPAAVAAAGLLFGYLEETQRTTLEHLRTVRFVNASDHVALDAATVRNLELCRSLNDGSTRATVLGVIDRAATPMGGRLLRDWLLRPSRQRPVIEARLEAVAALHAAGGVRERLRRDGLDRIRDLERLLARVTLGSASPRELLALESSARALPEVRTRAESLAAARLLALSKEIDELADIVALIDRAIADDAPVNPKDGGVIATGYSAELDELRSAATDGRTWMAQYEARERKATGIGSLKVRFHRVLGYSIEVTRANVGAVPPHYERRQTLATCERYTTTELKGYESKVLDAEERLVDLELETFAAVRQEIAGHAARIATTARAVAEIDALANFAEVASELQWCRPQIQDDGPLTIRAGRHPVVEAGLVSERFVANDLELDPDQRQILLVTGPNMGGKSTYLRQAALIVILAHAGSFVPAAQATIPLVDRVFTRVGASDDLARGRSTFMVEMTETANILHNATARSLVVLDEVGRGTATFDGLSLAWAIVEHLHEHPDNRPLVLFATHYHELTDLGSMLPRVANVRVVVRAHQGKIVFLRKIEAGASDRSYGIEVARLAGLPEPVVERARQVLRDLEAVELGLEERLRPDRAGQPTQLTLFVPASHPVLEELKRIDTDSLTPLEALTRLSELQRKVKAGL